mgnify:CR=1 FL=1
MATNKSLNRRTIFLLAAAILYLMIPQNATMPMPEEAVFPFSLLSLSQMQECLLSDNGLPWI